MDNELLTLVRAFEDFEKKIELVESLKLELKNLNTSGFQTEAQEIKAGLNDVDKIPFIKLKLKNLKEKICEKEKIEKEKQEMEKEREDKTLNSLKKDAEALEEYGFKIKRIIKVKK